MDAEPKHNSIDVLKVAKLARLHVAPAEMIVLTITRESVMDFVVHFAKLARCDWRLRYRASGVGGSS